jgi:hypothetical protein
LRWIAVVEELSSPGAAAASIADKTLLAASRSLRQAADERGAYLPLLALSRLAVAARTEPEFQAELDTLGVGADDREDGLRLLNALEQASVSSEEGVRTVFSDIAQRAYRETLLARVRSVAATLWGVSPDDVRTALARQATQSGYSELARDWFGRFVGRTLQYFIDRELSNHVGRGAASSSGDAVRLERDILAYAAERTRLIQEYAPGWLSKTVWTRRGIPEEAAQQFFGYAVKKILDDVALEQKDR